APPRFTLFPYTTLFRSNRHSHDACGVEDDIGPGEHETDGGTHQQNAHEWPPGQGVGECRSTQTVPTEQWDAEKKHENQVLQESQCVSRQVEHSRLLSAP